MSVLRRTDFLAGLVFAAFGLLILDQMRTIELGTATRMGPAYFPIILACLLLLLAAWLVLNALLGRSQDTVTAFEARPLLLITLGLIAFGLLVERTGMVVAVAVLVAFSVAGGERMRIPTFLLLTLALCLFAAGITGGLMGLTTSILPPIKLPGF
jgi:putative tricarboxylic transport membrane protein